MTCSSSPLTSFLADDYTFSFFFACSAASGCDCWKYWKAELRPQGMNDIKLDWLTWWFPLYCKMFVSDTQFFQVIKCMGPCYNVLKHVFRARTCFTSHVSFCLFLRFRIACMNMWQNQSTIILNKTLIIEIILLKYFTIYYWAEIWVLLPHTVPLPPYEILARPSVGSPLM